MNDQTGTTGELFNSLPSVYKAMINWPKRLAHEAPFFRRIVDQVSAKRLIDVACGTGQHAVMFHSWGLQVEGADVSSEMVQTAWNTTEPKTGLRFLVRDYVDSIETPEPFDIAVCIGNSLSLATDMAAVRQAISQMFQAIRPGGVVVVQVLNVWRLAEGPCLWQKCLRTDLDGSDSLIVKGITRCGNGAHVQLLLIRLDDQPQMQADSARFLGIEKEELGEIAHASGAGKCKFFGGYEDQPYDRSTSVDLVMVAAKV